MNKFVSAAKLLLPQLKSSTTHPHTIPHRNLIILNGFSRLDKRDVDKRPLPIIRLEQTAFSRLKLGVNTIALEYTEMDHPVHRNYISPTPAYCGPLSRRFLTPSTKSPNTYCAISHFNFSHRYWYILLPDHGSHIYSSFWPYYLDNSVRFRPIFTATLPLYWIERFSHYNPHRVVSRWVALYIFLICTTCAVFHVYENPQTYIHDNMFSTYFPQIYDESKVESFVLSLYHFYAAIKLRYDSFRFPDIINTDFTSSSSPPSPSSTTTEIIPPTSSTPPFPIHYTTLQHIIRSNAQFNKLNKQDPKFLSLFLSFLGLHESSNFFRRFRNRFINSIEGSISKDILTILSTSYDLLLSNPRSALALFDHVFYPFNSKLHLNSSNYGLSLSTTDTNIDMFDHTPQLYDIATQNFLDLPFSSFVLEDFHPERLFEVYNYLLHHPLGQQSNNTTPTIIPYNEETFHTLSPYLQSYIKRINLNLSQSNNPSTTDTILSPPTTPLVTLHSSTISSSSSSASPASSSSSSLEPTILLSYTSSPLLPPLIPSSPTSSSMRTPLQHTQIALELFRTQMPVVLNTLLHLTPEIYQNDLLERMIKLVALRRHIQQVNYLSQKSDSSDFFLGSIHSEISQNSTLPSNTLPQSNSYTMQLPTRYAPFISTQIYESLLSPHNLLTSTADQLFEQITDLFDITPMNWIYLQKFHYQIQQEKKKLFSNQADIDTIDTINTVNTINTISTNDTINSNNSTNSNTNSTNSTPNTINTINTTSTTAPSLTPKQLQKGIKDFNALLLSQNLRQSQSSALNIQFPMVYLPLASLFYHARALRSEDYAKMFNNDSNSIISPHTDQTDPIINPHPLFDNPYLISPHSTPEALFNDNTLKSLHQYSLSLSRETAPFNLSIARTLYNPIVALDTTSFPSNHPNHPNQFNHPNRFNQFDPSNQSNQSNLSNQSNQLTSPSSQDGATQPTSNNISLLGQHNSLPFIDPNKLLEEQHKTINLQLNQPNNPFLQSLPFLQNSNPYRLVLCDLLLGQLIGEYQRSIDEHQFKKWNTLGDFAQSVPPDSSIFSQFKKHISSILPFKFIFQQSSTQVNLSTPLPTKSIFNYELTSPPDFYIPRCPSPTSTPSTQPQSLKSQSLIEPSPTILSGSLHSQHPESQQQMPDPEHISQGSLPTTRLQSMFKNYQYYHNKAKFERIMAYGVINPVEYPYLSLDSALFISKNYEMRELLLNYYRQQSHQTLFKPNQRLNTFSSPQSPFTTSNSHYSQISSHHPQHKFPNIASSFAIAQQLDQV